MSTWLQPARQGTFPVPTHFYDEARPRLGSVTTDVCLWAFRNTLGIGCYGLILDLGQLANEIGHIPVDVADALDEAQAEGVLFLPEQTPDPLLVVAYDLGRELMTQYRNQQITGAELCTQALAVRPEIQAVRGGAR